MDDLTRNRSDNVHAAVHEALLPNVASQSLVALLAKAPLEPRWMIIECNADYPEGMHAAREFVRQCVRSIAGDGALSRNDADAITSYVYVELIETELKSVLAMDGANAMQSSVRRAAPDLSTDALAKSPPPAPHRMLRAIRRVWNSNALKRLAVESIRTVKADAAHSSFMALGEDIVWAVLDSGVDGSHPHFTKYDNLVKTQPLLPKNFSPTSTADPLTDPDGHGTHVAGIIAGECDPKASTLAAVQAIAEDGTPNEFHLFDVAAIRGMAPKCKILSLRIFDDAGDGDDIAAMQALEYVMELNAYGAHPRVHGVNLSAGYLPDPETYGVGHSPLCRTIDRLVRSGVVVVCAAGNFGWTPGSTDANGMVGPGQSGALASIADPGNACLAITVGSTHREKPHTYGVSFFSSKGPTVDGRMKPDIVAPGERIISCATGTLKKKVAGYLPDPSDGVVRDFNYAEDSGTSMSAPHVSGVIAAFLSVRREFIGEPERVLEIVRASAIDLRRDPHMQGAGLVDLFGMLQGA